MINLGASLLLSLGEKLMYKTPRQTATRSPFGQLDLDKAILRILPGSLSMAFFKRFSSLGFLYSYLSISIW
jgi:hypothetical protein